MGNTASRSISGTEGRITIDPGGTVGAHTLYLKKWKITFKTQWKKSMNQESTGDDGVTVYEERIPGHRVATLEAEGIFDILTTPADIGLEDGAVLTNVDCYLRKGNADLVASFPLFEVDEASIDVNVEGDNPDMFSFKGQSRGQFYEPSASVLNKV